MRVGYIQFEPIFGNKDGNIETIIRLLGEGVERDSTLLVLPELCNTGYVFKSKQELELLSEEIPEGDTTQALSTFTKENGLYVVAGVCEKKNGKYFNSAIFVGPKGFIDVYRKAHLFDKEKMYFNEGNTQFSVYDLSNAKIGIMICYDWFFPESIRVLALKGTHIICHPANLVLPYCQTALLGAAIQNKVFVITANRIGVERGLRFTGESQIIGPDMKILSKSNSYSEEVIVVEIDPRLAEEKRITDYNDLWEDRRVEFYRPITA